MFRQLQVCHIRMQRHTAFVELWSGVRHNPAHERPTSSSAGLVSEPGDFTSLRCNGCQQHNGVLHRREVLCQWTTCQSHCRHLKVDQPATKAPVTVMVAVSVGGDNLTSSVWVASSELLNFPQVILGTFVHDHDHDHDIT